MPRYVLVLLARFALVYGALVAACAVLPVYAWIERAATAIAAAPLRERAQEARSLRFEPRAEPPSYVYALRVGAVPRELQRPYHKHGFVLVLFAALALATPGLGWRRGALLFAAGGAAAFLLCVAMLMSDVELWERAAVAEAGLQPTRGPYAIPFGAVQGLHRTAAAGLLPVILWVFLVTRRGEARDRRSRATSAA
jgi:hypothetical protein